MRNLFAVSTILMLTISHLCLADHFGSAEAMEKNYSYSYWMNGWRKDPGNLSKDLLCFETGHYGLILDIKELSKPRFGLLADRSTLMSSLQSGTDRVSDLPPAELNIEVDVGGTEYRMVSCKAGRTKGKLHLKTVRIWEAGVVAQHFDIQDLV